MATGELKAIGNLHWLRMRRALLMAALLGHAAVCSQGLAQTAQQPLFAVEGSVSDAVGQPVTGALVELAPGGTAGGAASRQTTTDGASGFAFRGVAAGSYRLSAAKGALHSSAVIVEVGKGQQGSAKLVLADEPRSAGAASGAQRSGMEFSDTGGFTVAGLTDWTAVGGHGSDATLRTSEALARETSTLPPRTAGAPATSAPAMELDAKEEARLRSAVAAAPQSDAAERALGEYLLRRGRYEQALPLLQSAAANDHHRAADEYDLALACRGLGDYQQARGHIERALAQQDRAEWHRLAGELHEQLGDPLGAVQEEERAARLDPSEENEFAWGSELLLHRAVWQAAEVFGRGAQAHPASARMLTGLGAALFAGARYDDAAERLCQASDLDPAAPEPYLFLARVDTAAPSPLPCVEQKLAHFVNAEVGNATAHYLYAMALFRRHASAETVQHHLQQAIALNPQYGEAYLQLGVMAFDAHRYPEAIQWYRRATAAEPKLGEAHYRLGLAYDRTGNRAAAAEEFRIHDALEKAEADAVEAQRREVKQFLVVLQAQPGGGQQP
ncbi:MAG TPA: tetratricopeptide repeat protein [Acidobacteriaceae bacterium]